MNTPMRIALITILIAIALIAGGTALSKQYKSPTTTTSASATVTSEPNTITISNYMFSPAALMVKKGTTVTWKNADIARHTVTADQVNTNAPESMFFGKGESYAFTFAVPGTYTYHCEPHPYMKATVTVTE